MVTITVTEEEAKIIGALIRTAPVQGNLETLPKSLNVLATLLEKVEKAIHAPDEPTPVEEPTEVSYNKPRRRR